MYKQKQNTNCKYVDNCIVDSNAVIKMLKSHCSNLDLDFMRLGNLLSFFRISKILFYVKSLSVVTMAIIKWYWYKIN